DPNTALSKYKTDQGRLFVFKLGGYQTVKPLEPSGAPPTEPPAMTAADTAMAAKGFMKYHTTCLVCHGFFAQSEGEVPDLRLMPAALFDQAQFDAIVLDGALQDNGMAPFKDILSKDDAKAVRAYILQQAHLAWDQAHPKTGAMKP